VNTWYKTSQRLFREEQAALPSAQPGMSLQILASGTRATRHFCLPEERAVARGAFALQVPGSTRHYDYQIALVVPARYPCDPPVLYCDDPKLPVGNVDRHILRYGQACLAVRAEVRQRWDSNAGLLGFLDDLVAPFLTWQLYYEVHGEPPPWGERSHGVKGVWEFYAEILDIPPGFRVAGFMKLLARKNCPKGHEPCPCGSGQRLRHCHAGAVVDARKKGGWADVRADLSDLGEGVDEQRPLPVKQYR